MATRNSTPDHVFPKTDLWTFLFRRPEISFPDSQVILTDAATGRSYTFAELSRLSLHIGRSLVSRYGLAKGDVLSFIAGNSIDLPPVLWGALSVGVVVNPLNPAFPARELAHYLKNAGSKAVVTQEEFYPAVLEAARSTGLDPSQIIVLDKNDDQCALWPPSGVELQSLNTQYDNVVKNPEKDTSFLVYSSGTTGLPKGVLLSHANIVANLIQMASVDTGALGPKDKALAFLPFFHIYGLTAIVNSGLYLGMNTFVMPRFDFEAVCRCVQTFKITYIYIVPPVALNFLQDAAADRHDLSSIRLLNSAAAPLSKELIRSLRRRRGLIVRQQYGMSECSPLTHSQTFDEAQQHPGSVGRPVTGVVVRVVPVQDDSEAKSERQEGEIWIKGPNVFLGYHDNPQATTESLTSDGFYKTGDIGYEDENGHLVITDRIKELIKYNGFQIAPAELEGLLLTHPAVADCAVVGIASGQVGTELPRAFVKVLSTSPQNTEVAQELVDYVKANVVPYKQLRGGVIFLEAIPRNPSGKILRRVLKKQLSSKI